MELRLDEAAVKEAVSRALAEDVGGGDITTLALVPESARCRAEIVAKEAGVVAGIPLARETFGALDPGVSFEALAEDGEAVAAGAVVARVAGPARAILTGERAALNFLQRMSGIATLTARYVEAVEGTGARIRDTRKTAPGLRALDKYAVRAGGGENHRRGLFDAVLIKDNHRRAVGSVGEAVRRARGEAGGREVEAEAHSLQEVEEAAAGGADMILVDNMGAAEVRRAVEMVAGRCPVEVSGGVTLENVRELAECGVDYISVGALTHSAAALDLSLEITEMEA